MIKRNKKSLKNLAKLDRIKISVEPAIFIFVGGEKNKISEGSDVYINRRRLTNIVCNYFDVVNSTKF